MEKERLQTTSLVLIASIVVALLFFYDEFYVHTIEFASGYDYEMDFEENSAEVEGENVKDLIDINTASKEELMEVDGIGDALSQRILDYLSENGEIALMEELQNVTGIGDVLLVRMSEKFCVK